MKNQDIAVLLVVAFFSAIFSYLLSTQVIVGSAARQQKAATVDVISDEFKPADTRFFNKDSINPTTNSSLQNTNKTPFNGAKGQ